MDTSILRWAGSKRQLLPILLAKVPHDYERYIEPFCGSARLFFALHPKSAILGDINEELIHCYKILRIHPRRLARSASQILNNHINYLAVRKLSPSDLSPLDRAARFIYLNRYCFNGVYRTNKHGEFNVPRGSRTGKFPSEKQFVTCSVALRNADLLTTDFEDCLSRVKKKDFVYFDPPYATSDKPTIEEYGPNSFQHRDVARLIKTVRKIDQLGAMFLLSYINSEELINSIPHRWNIMKIRVRRHVSGFAMHREIVQEVLVSNYRR